jgi:hypothetical protein
VVVRTFGMLEQIVILSKDQAAAAVVGAAAAAAAVYSLMELAQAEVHQTGSVEAAQENQKVAGLAFVD